MLLTSSDKLAPTSNNYHPWCHTFWGKAFQLECWRYIPNPHGDSPGPLGTASWPHQFSKIQALVGVKLLKFWRFTRPCHHISSIQLLWNSSTQDPQAEANYYARHILQPLFGVRAMRVGEVWLGSYLWWLCWYALVTVVKTCQDDIGSGIFVGIAEPTCTLPIQHVTLTSGEVFWWPPAPGRSSEGAAHHGWRTWGPGIHNSHATLYRSCMILSHYTVAHVGNLVGRTWWTPKRGQGGAEDIWSHPGWEWV